MDFTNMTALNSDRNFLAFVKRDLVVGAVVELGGAGALVLGHGLGVFKRAAVVEIRRDTRGAKGVVAHSGRDADGQSPAL
jgi:hypothetical protein